MIIKDRYGQFFEVPEKGPGPLLKPVQQVGQLRPQPPNHGVPTLPKMRFGIYADSWNNAHATALYSLGYHFPAYASFWPGRRAKVYKLIQTVKVTPK